MRNYAYGARKPVENADLVYEQFRLAHAYQCALVAIERERRGLVDSLYRGAAPDEWVRLDAATKAEQEAFDRMRVCRSTGGDMLEPDEEMQKERREISDAAKAALMASREALKTAQQAWGDARRRVKASIAVQLEAVKTETYAKTKRAYNLAGTVGLAWGTRLKVGEWAEAAAKASMKVGTLPHFPRFDGTGSIVVQLQGDSGIEGKKGLDPAVAFSGGDTRIRLEVVDRDAYLAVQGKVVPEGAYTTPNAGNSKRSGKKTRAILRLRVGSDGRKPIWAAWPVTLHRPLPDNAPIKWVMVSSYKVGAHTEWQLMFTVDDVEVSMKPTDAGPTLAANLGWRNLPDGGLRVAYAVGSDGRKEEVRVPPSFVVDMAHVDSLQAIRDQRFEVFKKDLAEWADEREVPAWLQEETRYIDRWKSQKHVFFLVRRWERNRFSGDEQVFGGAVAWLKQDKHLRLWECHRRDSLLRMRREYYRTIAARWAKEYARVLVTDMDLRDFAELPAPEDGAKSKDKPQRVSQRMAAPSEVRGAMKNACSTRGTVFEEVDGKYKTQTCHVCGIVFAFAARQDLEHTCECGARWDQDENHAVNILASDQVTGGGGGPLAPVGDEGTEGQPEEKGGRWKKRRSQKAVT